MSKSFRRRFRAGSVVHVPAVRRRQSRLRLEALEDRRMLSTTVPHLSDLEVPPVDASSIDHQAAAISSDTAVRDVTVMSWNLYLGGDIGPTVGALLGAGGDPVEEMSRLWDSVRATDFSSRAVALADQIQAAQPDLIGLQEAVTWSTGPANDPTPAPDVQVDFTQILLEELASRGLDYEVVIRTTQTDAEFPGFTDLQRSNLADIRIVDQGVILASRDLKHSELQLSGVQEGTFHTRISFEPAVPLTIVRGWNAVDATIRGKSFRFINTHLESFHRTVQELQADELLAGPADTRLPVILVGDLNSDADPNSTRNQTDTYEKFIAAGFADAWSATRPDEPGFTCCQAADLLNPISDLGSRIDFVMVRGESLRVGATDLVGEEADDRADSNLWPSDHAGVVATVGILPRGPSKTFAQGFVLWSAQDTDSSTLPNQRGSHRVHPATACPQAIDMAHRLQSLPPQPRQFVVFSPLQTNRRAIDSHLADEALLDLDWDALSAGVDRSSRQ